MPVKVIDASALAAVLFNDPDSDKVIADIARGTLVAPQRITYEIASVCLKKIRAHPGRRDMFLAAFQLIDRLDVDLVSVDLGDVVALAADTGLTVYDACYLWLARFLKTELLTLDKKLAAAMAR